MCIELSRPADPNLMCLEIVMRNGKLFTFMMSADKVTSLYCAMMGLGTSVPVMRTALGVRRVVLPLRHPMSGPQMNSAFFISWTVIGQLGIKFWLTYRMKSLTMAVRCASVGIWLVELANNHTPRIYFCYLLQW